MDEIDLQILSELIEDARKPFSAIAKNIGLATQTVIRRYKNLKKSNKLYLFITIDPKKLGYVGEAMLFMKSLPGNDLSDVFINLKKMPAVIIVTKGLGAFEGYAVMLFKNFTDLSEKIKAIKKIPTFGECEIALSKIHFPEILPKIDTSQYNI